MKMAERKIESSNTQKWDNFINPIKAPVRRSERLKEKYEEYAKVIQDYDGKKGPPASSFQSIGSIACLSKKISVKMVADRLAFLLSQVKIGSGAKTASVQSGFYFPLYQSTFDLIPRYVSFDEVQCLDLSWDSKDQTETTFLEEMINHIRAQDPRSESGARELIDYVINEVSRLANIKIKTEFPLYFKNLPGGKPDYFFTDMDGTPLGCLEAKQAMTFGDNAFSQTLMELLLVQQEALREGVDIQHTPVFGILSDGKRYVLMMLDGDHLRLEKTGEPGTLRVRSLKEKDDVKDLINAIIQMIRLCQKSKKPDDGKADA